MWRPGRYLELFVLFLGTFLSRVCGVAGHIVKAESDPWLASIDLTRSGTCSVGHPRNLDFRSMP